ncbi:hypothetical protein [Streptomyces albus]|uniref:Uncharacterized protein n=1 Tax=Streptomyces albus TaxID=1888 RepID=A0A8H1LGH9_9ACTN|nr:hypothetical protein [Streptomyces albus]TGG84623.1 hypothetical protein D8771_12255 [Streptomyces albus]UVN56332.1 hypothetical protein NR995_18740 [Streptomyces albus]
MRSLRKKSPSTTLAVVDHQERVLLCRPHGERTWLPVKASVLCVRTSKLSVIHVLDPLFSHWFLAATPVIGRFNPVADRDCQSDSMRIFVVRHRRMRTISLRARTRASPDADLVWHPLSDVEDEQFNVNPRELGPFLRGYLEGWIPDGVITLVE